MARFDGIDYPTRNSIIVLEAPRATVDASTLGEYNAVLAGGAASFVRANSDGSVVSRIAETNTYYTVRFTSTARELYLGQTVTGSPVLTVPYIAT